MTTHKKSRQRGFTLFEVALVITLMCILLLMILPRFTSTTQDGRQARAVSDIGLLGQAIGRVRADTSVSTAGCLTNLSNLTQLVSISACVPAGQPFGVLSSCANAATPDQSCWDGPYFTEIGSDPWSNAYWVTEDTNFKVTVHCNGPDGIPNTADDLTSLQ